jgi:hypothetical protein
LHVDRKVIERARQDLIERGWFTVNSRKGGRTGRALVVDICHPHEAPREEPAVLCWKCGGDTYRVTSKTGQIGFMCRAEPWRDPEQHGHYVTGEDGQRFPDAA